MDYALVEIVGGEIYVLWFDFWSLNDCMQEAIEQLYISDSVSSFVCTISSMV